MARYGNAHVSSQGHFVERRYWSRRRPSPEQTLQSLGYVLEHPIKHSVPGGFDDEDTSGRLYRRGTPDGVATAVVGLFMQTDPERRWDAIVELFRELYADPRWPEQGVEAARDVIARHPDVIDKKGWCVPIKVAVWAGEEAAKRARNAVLTAPRQWVEFSARKVPRMGGIVTVVFREAPPIPCAFNAEQTFKRFVPRTLRVALGRCSVRGLLSGRARGPARA